MDIFAKRIIVQHDGVEVLLRFDQQRRIDCRVVNSHIIVATTCLDGQRSVAGDGVQRHTVITFVAFDFGISIQSDRPQRDKVVVLLTVEVQ